MTFTDRTQKRLRVLLSVVVVCAVLATFSDVRKVIGQAVSAVCGKNHSALVAPVHQIRSSTARPSMIFHDRRPGVSGLPVAMGL